MIDISDIKPDSLYPPSEAALFLGKSEKTLTNLRAQRTGPAFHKLGHTLFYRGRDLIDYIESSFVQSGHAPKTRRITRA